MPNILSIFLASSSELSRERNFIGNRVRMLNDEWELRGVRIILNVWEDYEPEYTGERKQTQYDIDLVDKSDIVFGLFRTVCGKYSQEEVRRAKKNNPNALYCYKLPADNDAAVMAFESASNIAIEAVPDVETVWGKMKLSVVDYIDAHFTTDNNTPQVEKEKIYLTLGEDLRNEEDALGNMIRGVDLLADQQIGKRCMMLPTHRGEMIAESNYYMALFDRVLDKESRDEFVTAYNGLSHRKKPAAIAPFQKKGGTVTRYDADNDVADILNRVGKEFFPITYESIDTVKLTLIVHLLNTSKVLSPNTALTIGQENYLYLGGERVVETSKALGLHTEQVSEFVVIVQLLELMMPSTAKLGEESRLRGEITDLLSEENLSKTEAEMLVKKCTRLIGFLKRNVRRFYQPDYVLRMMLLRIVCNDRYDEQIGYTPDSFYKEFVDYADRHSVADVIVEEMRINFANGYARAGMEDEAMRLYGEARRNLRQKESFGRLHRHKYFLLYYNALAVLSITRQESELEQWARDLEEHVERWTAEDASLSYYNCYPLAFRIDVLSVDELADEKLISAAEECWGQTASMTDSSEDGFSCLQAVHGLTKSLARYYLDRISVDGLAMEVRQMYAEKSKFYLGHEEELCKELMKFNRDEAMKHYAAMLHNRGFLMAKMDNPMAAFGSYIQSLYIRKQLYAYYPTVSREDDVAETLVNIGALLLESNGTFVSNNPEVKTDSLYYAETALEIYARHNDGTLPHATNEYKARLLKGTVLNRKGQNEEQKQEGLHILQDVKRWDEENPDNYYHSTIMYELNKIFSAE